MATPMDQPMVDVNEMPSDRPGAERFDPEYGRTFRKRNRNLELTIYNNTRATLRLAGEYFNTGTWFQHFSLLSVPPGEQTKAFVTNKSHAPTGVTGSVLFT